MTNAPFILMLLAATMMAIAGMYGPALLFVASGLFLFQASLNRQRMAVMSRQRAERRRRSVRRSAL